MSRIFISYSRADAIIVENLSKLLRQSFTRVWYDLDLEGESGADWWARIIEEIHNCEHFIYLLSNDSVNSEYCQKEFEAAQSLSKHVIPVLIRKKTHIPESLQKIQYIEMFGDITVEGLNKIYSSIIRNSKFLASNDRAYYESDLRLLENIWPLISSPFLDKLIQGIFNAEVENDLSVDYLWMYLYQRQKSENTFINQELEQAFQLFDDVSKRFHSSLNKHYKHQRIDNKAYLVLPKNEGASNGFGQEEILLLLEELRHNHKSVVRAIKSLYPEFDFAREEKRHQRIRQLINLRENLEHHKGAYLERFGQETANTPQHANFISLVQRICIEAYGYEPECPEGCIEIATEPNADINEFIRWDQKCRNSLLYIAHKRLTPIFVTREINPLEARIWGEGRQRNEYALTDAINQINRIIRQQKPLYSESST